MSKESARAFLDKLESDASFRSALIASGDASDGSVSYSVQKLAELGAQRGFDFTAEEIGEAGARHAKSSVPGARSQELSENQLESVAGGAATGSGDGMPMEQISMNYAKIEFSYKQQKPDGSLGGSLAGGYDLKKNR